MKDQEIVHHVKMLFDQNVSPGEAFDFLFKLRQARLSYHEVFNAIVRSGKSVDEDHDQVDQPQTFECPGCGVSRTDRVKCINPECPEYQANPVTDAINAERTQRLGTDQHRRDPKFDPKFKDPIPSFGKYKPSPQYPRGLKLSEIGDKDPGYLDWLINSDQSTPFWREQARLAKVFVSFTAPHYRDTDATGYFG